MELPEEVAFFIAQRLRTNVRELEGALNRVKAMQDFKGGHIDIDFVRDTLKRYSCLTRTFGNHWKYSESRGRILIA